MLSEVWDGYASSFVLFLHNCLGNSGFLCYLLNFRIICCSSVWKIMDNFIGMTLNLQIALSSIAILTIQILPTQEHGVSFQVFKSSLISFIIVLYFSTGGGNGNTLQFLPGESHGQRNLLSYSPWGCTVQDTTKAIQHTYFSHVRLSPLW